MRLLAAVLAASLAACQAPPQERAFHWVWLVTGARDPEVRGEARTQAFLGHFANMQRLTEEGLLLLAGPLGPPQARADHRGVFVLATADPAAARAAAATDPGAQAGIFALEYEPFRTTSALEMLPAMHEAAVAASGVENPEPGFHARAYLLVRGEPAAAAEQAMAARGGGPAVLFQGRIGAGSSEAALFCLDVAEPPGQPNLPASVAWILMPWFATEEVAVLGGRGSAGP